jgi:hypothetical protein
METYKDLHKLTKEELEAKYDQVAKNTTAGLSFYREELARREAEEQNQRMLKMTQQMKNLTIAITILTVINVVVIFIQIF